MRKREWLAAICFIIATILFAAFFSAAVTPKQTEYGANWGSFLREEKNSVDIMFFGSSVVYCDIVPEIIGERTGRSAYVLAGPEQTLTMTYYYIREMYNTQSPSLVFIEVTGAFYPEYTDFIKTNIGYMPWSPNRLAATFKTARPEEWTGLLFPPYNYHSRWHELDADSFSGYETDPRRGYTYLDAAVPAEGITERAVEFLPEVYADNISYLRKINELCLKKGSMPVFFIAPSYWPWEPAYVDMLESDIDAFGGKFIDFNENIDEMDIDSSTDFYDVLHFNYSGAAKYSAYLARVIKDIVP